MTQLTIWSGARIVDMLDKYTEWRLIVLLLSVITAPFLVLVTSHFIRKWKMHYKKAQGYSEWVMILVMVTVLIAITVVFT